MNNIITIDQLAQSLNLSLVDLRDLGNRAKNLYGKLVLKKDNGEDRVIYPPSDELKAIQRLLLQNVLYQLPMPEEIFHGRGNSPKKIMNKHLNKKC